MILFGEEGMRWVGVGGLVEKRSGGMGIGLSGDVDGR